MFSSGLSIGAFPMRDLVCIYSSQISIRLIKHKPSEVGMRSLTSAESITAFLVRFKGVRERANLHKPFDSSDQRVTDSRVMFTPKTRVKTTYFNLLSSTIDLTYHGCIRVHHFQEDPGYQKPMK